MSGVEQVAVGRMNARFSPYAATRWTAISSLRSAVVWGLGRGRAGAYRWKNRVRMIWALQVIAKSVATDPPSLVRLNRCLRKRRPPPASTEVH